MTFLPQSSSNNSRAINQWIFWSTTKTDQLILNQRDFPAKHYFMKVNCDWLTHFSVTRNPAFVLRWLVNVSCHSKSDNLISASHCIIERDWLLGTRGRSLLGISLSVICEAKGCTHSSESEFNNNETHLNRENSIFIWIGVKYSPARLMVKLAGVLLCL